MCIRDSPCVVRKAVVEAKVNSLRIHRGQAIAGDGVDAEGLLHAEDRLDTANRAVQPAEALRTVIRFYPVALGMLASAELGTQTESRIFGFPPDMSAKEVFARALKETVIRETGFKTLVWQIDAGPAA